MRFVRQSSRLQLLLAIILVSLLALGVRPFVFRAHADRLPNRMVQIENPTQDAVTTYKFSFDIATAGDIGSIRFQFCNDTPLVDEPCNPPAGFDASAAVLAAETGETGFSVLPNPDDNILIITRAITAATPQSVSYLFDAIHNASSQGSNYVRIQTYASADATGPHTDYGGLAYVLNDVMSINATVPPYLLFCAGLTIDGYDCSTASGNYLNFGELSSHSTKSGQTQLLAATNTDDGYNVWMNGSTMASGTDVIPGLLTTDVSRPGTSQFGVNLVANDTPDIGQDVAGPGVGEPTAAYSVKDHFRFVPGEQIISAPTINDYRKYTISYIVNIANTQTAGIYVSTLTYVCVANF